LIDPKGGELLGAHLDNPDRTSHYAITRAGDGLADAMRLMQERQVAIQTAVRDGSISRTAPSHLDHTDPAIRARLCVVVDEIALLTGAPVPDATGLDMGGLAAAAKANRPMSAAYREVLNQIAWVGRSLGVVMIATVQSPLEKNLPGTSFRDQCVGVVTGPLPDAVTDKAADLLFHGLQRGRSVPLGKGYGVCERLRAGDPHLRVFRSIS
jgi:hypothetical protein